MRFFRLMQMLAIGGALMISFLSWTSLFYPGELVQTRIGSSVLVLIILVYGSRIVEEFVLPSRVSIHIIGVCLLIALVYIYIFIAGMSSFHMTTPIEAKQITS